jgi:hypothetical protein
VTVRRFLIVLGLAVAVAFVPGATATAPVAESFGLPCLPLDSENIVPDRSIMNPDLGVWMLAFDAPSEDVDSTLIPALERDGWVVEPRDPQYTRVYVLHRGAEYMDIVSPEDKSMMGYYVTYAARKTTSLDS